jgi:Domain of unknown function (DUF4424)
VTCDGCPVCQFSEYSPSRTIHISGRRLKARRARPCNSTPPPGTSTRVLNGKDVTNDLRQLGMPLAPREPLRKESFSRKTLDRLVSVGLVDPNSEPLTPQWTLKTTYYWQQTFPAHRVVAIDHRYLPSVGGSVPLSTTSLRQYMDKSAYCTDQDFLNSMMPPNRMWSPHYVGYVLVTGANWAGPIKKFRLVIDKGSPDNLVSFCGRNVRKIGPTQFEMSASNFTPTSDLRVLFLTRPASGE